MDAKERLTELLASADKIIAELSAVENPRPSTLVNIRAMQKQRKKLLGEMAECAELVKGSK